ncbi:hypothetical protein Y032_0027g1515 [Ancylostoma ceylanicum]|uniref:Uncharacterized protein n=1 Tax=Ancylostoma ceylanicum TaxID=53326 RepID=A0A016UU03_9BILA|nr:hypothetical protein Y032_0027g1515 [Ancylostoma ceylanicum]
MAFSRIFGQFLGIGPGYSPGLLQVGAELQYLAALLSHPLLQVSSCAHRQEAESLLQSTASDLMTPTLTTCSNNKSLTGIFPWNALLTDSRNADDSTSSSEAFSDTTCCNESKDPGILLSVRSCQPW